MKKLFLSLTLIAAVALGLSAQEVVTGPAISIDKEVHDYGTIKKGADGTCTFVVTNTGTEPLIMSNCKGSCGCTVPKCDMTPILPGESSEITVKYDTNRIGPINKSVTVTSNAVNEPTKIIRIKGKVEDPNAGTAPAGSPVKPTTPGVPTNPAP